MSATTVPAQEIHLRDSIAEGSAVAAITFQARERWNSLTGEVTRPRMVEVSSMPARIVAVEFNPDGSHQLHHYDTSSISVQTFEWDEQVRVIRPAPIEPCACGFPEARNV